MKLLLFIGCLLLMAVVKPQQPKLILPIGHTGRVCRASFSPDNKKIVTAGNTPKIWDATSGTLLANLNGHSGYVLSACFSPDGKKIVTASMDHTAKIWDAQSCILLADLKGHTDQVTSAYFSPNGKKIVTASDDHTAKIWDAANGTLLTDLKANLPFNSSAMFSPDGKKIITNSWDSTVKIWDTNSGALLFDLKGHTDHVLSAYFSPDGKKIVTASSDHTAKIWDAANGTFLIDLKGHTSYVINALFSPDGKKILTASDDSTTKIWDTNSGRLLVNVKGQASKLQSACFSPDGKRILTTGWQNNTPKIWDAQNGILLSDLKGHDGSVNCAYFSTDGKKIVTASDDHTAKIWDAGSGQLIAELKGHSDGVMNASFSPDGENILTASGDNTAKIWGAQSGILLFDLKGLTGSLNGASFSPDGKKIVTASSDHTAKIWNAVSGALLADLTGHTGSLNGARFSPDGKKTVTFHLVIPEHTGSLNGANFSPDGKKIVAFYLDNNTAKLWDAQSGALLTELTGHNSLVTRACFSPDGKKIVTAAYDSTAKIWDTQSGALLTDLNDDRLVGSACFSPDGKKIQTSTPSFDYTINDYTTKIWDAQNGNFLFKIKGSTDKYNSTPFSPDGKKIITTLIDGNAEIWDAQTGAPLLHLKGPRDGINRGCFSPDGKKILLEYQDNSAKLWNAMSGNLLADLKEFGYVASNDSFSPDGKKIVSADLTGGMAKIWDANNGRLLYTFFALDSSDYFFQLPSGYYKCSPNAAKLLHYVDKDLKVSTFEQLDVKYNRPDLVLEGIGCPDTDLIQSYKKAWQKRIIKLGFDTSLFSGGFHVPETDIQNRDSVQNEQTSNKLFLKITAKDDSVMLDRYNVWINEVPLFGIRGISLKSRNIKHFDTTIKVTLSMGNNRIEYSVTNVGGLESYRIPLDVKYTAPQQVKERLYFIGIGMDHFNDNRYNLSWSVKDIRDLANSFKNNYGQSCTIDTLFDKEVSIENVRGLKERLLKTTENDKVIVAYSGHGLLSKDYDYFLSTYTVDFKEPENGGLPYGSLEDLLDGIPARKKLMLIDACHSGEVDKEELNKMVRTQAQLDNTKKGVIGLIDTTNKRLGTKNSFELMQEVFVNVGRSTGATIISAAAGTQFALERGDLENGVFSYSILELMKKKSTVTVSELKKYVNQRVTELTSGMQVPTSRNENKVMDWQVW